LWLICKIELDVIFLGPFLSIIFKKKYFFIENRIRCCRWQILQMLLFIPWSLGNRFNNTSKLILNLKFLTTCICSLFHIFQELSLFHIYFTILKPAQVYRIEALKLFVRIHLPNITIATKCKSEPSLDKWSLSPGEIYICT
jgi:hypothetical protein